MNIKTQESWPARWLAYDDDSYDGPGSALGHGQSEQEAIEDLMEQLIERGIESDWPSDAEIGRREHFGRYDELRYAQEAE